MNLTRLFRAALAAALALPTLHAQVPDTLRHSISAPPTIGVQSDADFGRSVAVDGGLTAVGAPGANFGAYNSGVVKVFDSATGALLHVLVNPTPTTGDGFGGRVAISGTRVVVGAAGDDTGASEAGSAYVFDLSSATPTVPVATLNNPAPALGDRFGWSVGISGTRVVVSAYQDDAGAVDSGSAYVYDLGGPTPTIPVATLNNPGPAVSDQFGYSVAISGTRVVVGAFMDDTGASNAGSAYVYDLSSATPTVPVRTLNNPGPAANDWFGVSVSISGTRVLVGAYHDDAGANDAGSAYVYDLSSATPTVPVATLNNPSPVLSDFFGNAVAIDGTRVVVGAFWDNAGMIDEGSTYVYDLSSPTPTVPVAILNNPGPAVSDHFGSSVAVAGTRVLVGTPEDGALGGHTGSVTVYELSSPTPTVPVTTLNNAGPATGDAFGNAVAVSGARLVVGAINDDTGAVDAGSVYVYDLTSGAPTAPLATLHNPYPVPNDYFGASVAISGTRVVVGACADGSVEGDMGSAYVYDLSSPTPTVPVLALDNPGLPGSHLFGNSVAIAGTRVVIGVPLDDTGALGTGRAYVYDLSSATPAVPVMMLDNPIPVPDDNFGYAVGISGTRIVVGVLNSDIGAIDSGRAYVYDLASATPDLPVRTLNNPSPATSDGFGFAVAISGTRVVVGAVLDDTGAIDAGSAYVYDLSSATPTVPVATLNNPSPAESDVFGRAVGISGTRVVVGAFRDDTGAPDAGTVYLYDLASGTPTVPIATLNNPGPADSDFFGSEVAIDGTTIATGAVNDDSVALDKGAAYIFAPANPDFDGDSLLDLWEYAHFGTTIGHGPLDDSDGDGRSELFEEAFNTDPLKPDTATPAVVNEGGFLTLTLAKRAGVTYLGQSAATPDTAAFSAATTTVLTNDATTLKVRDNFPIAGGGQRFLRVKASAAP